VFNTRADANGIWNEATLKLPFVPRGRLPKGLG
jgi:hypothetical protein